MPARRMATVLLGLVLMGSGADGRQQPRLRYPALAESMVVTRHGHPQIGYPALPPDPRIAPDDFALDSIDETDAALNRADGATARPPLPRYQPRPAIWQISDRDTRIYMIGTIHVLPPDIAWRTPLLDSIVARSRLLIVESVEDGSGIDGLLAQPPAARRLPPLAARVSPDHRQQLALFAATLPPEAASLFDRMPTWIASVAVAFVREMRLGDVPGPGADDWLESTFKAAGKPVVAIEDSNQVLGTMNMIAESDQRAMLDAALDARDRSWDERRAPLLAWAKGEIGPNSPLTIDLVSATGSSALSGPLLTTRNRAWAAALAKQLRKPGTMLFAAGAAHFIGTASVIDQLEARGVRVRRVQ